MYGMYTACRIGDKTKSNCIIYKTIIRITSPLNSGLVQGWAAIIMGVCSGSIPWFTMMVVHKKFELLQKVDDTMAVFHTHAVAGSLGGILTGLFAEPRLNRIFFTGNIEKYIGLFYGFRTGRVQAGFRQIGVQLLGIVFIITLNVVMTSLICLAVQFVVPLRMSEEDMEIGDEAVHGEEAYSLWEDGNDSSVHAVRGEGSAPSNVEMAVRKRKGGGRAETV